MSRNPASWPEVIHKYYAHLRSSYNERDVLTKWRDKYAGSFLFCKEYMDRNKQFPPWGRSGFNELFVGTKYLDAGYDALFAYLRGECEKCRCKCYQKARELLGGHEAEQFIENEGGGRPPDLLVFDKQSSRFRFVECKGKGERFTPTQVPRFTGIEEYLNRNSTAQPLTDPRNTTLFPPLHPGQWIHIARVVPEQLVGSIPVAKERPIPVAKDGPIPVAKEGYVVIGRLSINREKLAAELKAYEEGTLKSRDKLSWWRNHNDEAKAALDGTARVGEGDEAVELGGG